MDGLSRPERKTHPGINVHRRLAGGAAEAAGTTPSQRRQDPRYRPERRATTIFGLGALLPEELLQAADPSRENPRSEWGARLHLKQAFGQRPVGEMTTDEIEL